ncbi:MAG: serine hydrolase domain-containing protein [Rhizobiaceae bacterium]
MNSQSSPLSVWESADPQSVGFEETLSDRIDFGARSGLLGQLHSVVVTRLGKIVVERYYAGQDYHWGRPLGEIAHGPDTLHDVRSVTKSIVSLLYGIALGRGEVPPPSAPLLAQFRQLTDLASDPQGAQLTIAHALTMSLGTDWNEDIPYSNPENSEIQMEQAPDRLRYILERPITHEPGSRWVYNGGATALLGAIIEQGTGQTLEAFAAEALFGPLGINQFAWTAGQDGKHSAASGLRLTCRGLARIGQMVLNKGHFEGRHIVSEDWLNQATTAHVSTTEGPDYGYQWWLGAAPVRAMNGDMQRWFGAFGNGGQRLFIMPATGIVMSAFFGNYDEPNSWMYPGRIWWEMVLPGLERV